MPEDIESLNHAIRQTADERGLFVFEGFVSLNDNTLPEAYWQGDWPGFIEAAVRADATILYIAERRYDPGQFLESKIFDLLERNLAQPQTNSKEAAGTHETEVGSSAWLRERISDAIDPWEAQAGRVIEFTCVLLKDVVAHTWSTEAEWFVECQKAVTSIGEEARQLRRDGRQQLTEETDQRIHELAGLMARHPRFQDATNEAKREYMASQLFPDSSLGFTSRAIAERTVLIHWWEVGPEAAATQAELARQLHRQGASIRRIAAELKISESNARGVIREPYPSPDGTMLGLWDNHSESVLVRLRAKGCPIIRLEGRLSLREQRRISRVGEMG